MSPKGDIRGLPGGSSFGDTRGERVNIHHACRYYTLQLWSETSLGTATIWVNLFFLLEDFNEHLLKLFHGTQHPELEIVLVSIPSIFLNVLMIQLLEVFYSIFARLQRSTCLLTPQ